MPKTGTYIPYTDIPWCRASKYTFFSLNQKKKKREKEKKPDLLYILQTQFSESAIRRSFNIEVAKASLFVLLWYGKKRFLGIQKSV